MNGLSTIHFQDLTVLRSKFQSQLTKRRECKLAGY